MLQLKEGKLAKIKVAGVVQGVGFRPFVYRLALQHNLKGWVRNTSGSVEIEVEGSEKSLKGFINDLQSKAPPLARIEKVETALHSPKGYADFRIHHSLSQKGKHQLVSPDIATCEDCKSEVLSPDDRRFGYPFTNCTNCGPRFTIIEDIPYDRPRTTMREFVMCPDCQHEYSDPLDRRFHAQPNACPRCGPSLELVDNRGKPVKGDDLIEKSAELLKAGKVVAIKGLGGFLLACDATDQEAVELLRARKKRPSKPLAVMMTTIEDVEKHCVLSAREKELLESPEAPIVLLLWKRRSSSVCQAVAPNLKYLGVMLPYTPLHHLLMNEVGVPLVMTSGNLSEEPIAKDNRDIYARYDDSVFMVEDDTPQPLRRTRGYAPYPIFLPFKAKQILACGGEEKNTFCLTKGNHAFLSQHIGNMENEETLEHFASTIELHKKLFRIKPEIIACDMHPEYLSTKYALEVGEKSGSKLVPVQHHHAHIVSCMVENNVEEPVIGVAFDGTGYGSDGTIWGGEFLLTDWHSFRRVGHLEYVPLPGGAAAIKKPYRMALSYLYSLLGENTSLEGLPVGDISTTELEMIRQQLRKKINTPLTSSAGRLFDAVSALTGVRGEIDYDAQAAIELEMAAPNRIDISEFYPFSIVDHEGTKVIKMAELFSALVIDIRDHVSTAEISLKFHHTVSQMIVQMCRLIAKETGIKQVALGGGVFQNRLLLRLVTATLRKEGLSVLTHKLVPANDGCISLGQAVIANFTRGD
jgi:hydrogenase maturation protein HypF